MAAFWNPTGFAPAPVRGGLTDEPGRACRSRRAAASRRTATLLLTTPTETDRDWMAAGEATTAMPPPCRAPRPTTGWRAPR